MGLFSGKRPNDLGVTGGRLRPCPGKPNCVCSQDTGPLHRIEPLRFEGDPCAAWAALHAAIARMKRVNIVTDGANYLYAEFSTKHMGYTDDAEFLLDTAAGAIQVRSAARLGNRDYGVNRGRIEAIRTRFDAALRAA